MKNNEEVKDFRRLVKKERDAMNTAQAKTAAAEKGTRKASEGDKEKPSDGAKATDYVVSTSGCAEEPWVTFTTDDRVGLALSGGGIRSATFNLGLLQALNEKGVLKQVDYLSTVSGGGYIGGFWTRWWHAVSEKEPEKAGQIKDFPPATEKADGTAAKKPKEMPEPAAIRHLREFSRFLIPRQGLNMEFWSAAITVLCGVVTSLVAALATVLLVMALWALLAAQMIEFCPIWNGAILIAIIGAVFGVSAWISRRSDESEVAPSMRKTFKRWRLFWASMAVVLTGVFWALTTWRFAKEWETRWQCLLPESGAILFVPCMVLAGSLVVLTITRLGWERLRKEHDTVKRGRHIARAAALEQVMGRLLAIQVAWAVMAGVWALAQWLKQKAGDGNFTGVGGTGTLTAVLTMLFVWTRDWLTPSKEEPRYTKFLDKLKPWVPQLLANGIVVLLFVLAAVFILGCNSAGGSWLVFWILLACLGVLVVVALLFDPTRVGMHEFYRARLTRCYLGASEHAEPEDLVSAAPRDRTSVEHSDDDMRLHDDNGKPIHLICCAANHLWGDPMSTLHRGARSAVLSRHGIAIGNCWIEDNDLWLSAALTASAAAFNSLMGERNMELGRAVAFVMTALNLRLGLWVKNPAHWICHDSKGCKVHDLQKNFPGLLFFKEMFGIAQCRTDGRAAAYMHLSDGGHFENLALYELIRRHCRYVIVSDAGQDPEFDFTDFGRATRRVREDFGVEIEINLTPLKPDADGISKQHLAVGTIHYDGVAGTDKGTIVYFKPSLVGDEPPDVLQYRRRAPDFPHETTGDQFFDEAQWESYRRLGEHICHASLRMVKQCEFLSSRELFRQIRMSWYRVPWMQGDSGIRLCEHAAALENALREHDNPALRREFFRDMLSAAPVSPVANAGTAPAAAVGQTASDVLMAIRALKFMEEAWLICELDDYWSHPLANNWMACLHRWAAMPTVRHWWPLLAPLFGTDFQSFARGTLKLPSLGPDRVALKLVLNSVKGSFVPEDGFAWRRIQECQPDFRASQYNTLFSLELTLPATSVSAALTIQVGLAFLRCDGSVARWDIDDLFIPPELHGGGFTTRLLDLLIKHFMGQKGVMPNPIVRLEVSIKPSLRDQAARQEQIELIDFYRSRGFKFVGTTCGSEKNNCMVRLI
ncbi:MAG: patatin-like phospholipase family protein [Verrucomicrobiia bacterium]